MHFPPLLTDLCVEMPNQLDHSFNFAQDTSIEESFSVAEPMTASNIAVSTKHPTATLAPVDMEDNASSFLNDTPYSMALDDDDVSIEESRYDHFLQISYFNIEVTCFFLQNSSTQLTQQSVKARDRRKTIPQPKILRKIQEPVQYDATSSDQELDSDTSDINLPF